jgi:site-specific DNA-cytosine methylase
VCERGVTDLDAHRFLAVWVQHPAQLRGVVEQARSRVIAANECDVDAAHTYLCNLGSPQTRIVFCTPEDEQRWVQRRKRPQRYHAQPDRPPLEPGSGWIAGQTGVRPCEVFFLGDVRALTGEQILAELDLQGDEVGCVFGGPPCQGGSSSNRAVTAGTAGGNRKPLTRFSVRNFSPRLHCHPAGAG